MNDLESFGHLEGSVLSDLAGALGDPLDPVVGLADLAMVSLQRLDLPLEGSGNVYELVRMLGAEVPQLGDLPRFEAGVDLLRVGPRVAGAGVNGVGAGDPDVAMVRMEGIGAEGVV